MNSIDKIFISFSMNSCYLKLLAYLSATIIGLLVFYIIYGVSYTTLYGLSFLLIPFISDIYGAYLLNKYLPLLMENIKKNLLSKTCEINNISTEEKFFTFYSYNSKIDHWLLKQFNKSGSISISVIFPKKDFVIITKTVGEINFEECEIINRYDDKAMEIYYTNIDMIETERNSIKIVTAGKTVEFRDDHKDIKEATIYLRSKLRVKKVQ